MNPQNTPAPAAPAETGGAHGALADTKNRIVETARDAVAKVKSATAGTTAKAREHAAQIATEKKETAARRLGGCSDALHDSARSLEDRDPNIAWFTHRAADKLQGVADYMRERDFAGLRADAEDIARRHPAAFFGGMFVAGLLLGNVVKSSRRKLETNDDTFDGPRDSQASWSEEGDMGAAYAASTGSFPASTDM